MLQCGSLALRVQTPPEFLRRCLINYRNPEENILKPPPELPPSEGGVRFSHFGPLMSGNIQHHLSRGVYWMALMDHCIHVSMGQKDNLQAGLAGFGNIFPFCQTGDFCVPAISDRQPYCFEKRSCNEDKLQYLFLQNLKK